MSRVYSGTKLPSIVLMDILQIRFSIYHMIMPRRRRRRQRKRSLLLSSHYIIAPRAIYFMLHTQLLCFDFIKSNQEKFISFYRFAIEHDSNKTFSSDGKRLMVEIRIRNSVSFCAFVSFPQVTFRVRRSPVTLDGG